MTAPKQTTGEVTQPLRFPHFPKNLRRCRDKLDRSQAWVARKAGISKTYLWELEHDEEGKKAVSAHVLWMLSRVFGVTMEALLGPPAT